jgi:hypothetical protein
VTTIHRRSFSGPELTHFASTLLVCAGLVLLLAEPVSSDRVALSEAGTSVCAESPHGPRDQQWTNGAALDASDSCDDEDDDDDGDDESSGGSGQAIAVSKHIPTNHNDASPLIYVGNDANGFHPLHAPSLRGPPTVHQESSDADFDDDDGDESLRAHHHVLTAPANGREPHVPARVDIFHTASLNTGHALRAPPH